MAREVRAHKQFRLNPPLFSVVSTTVAVFLVIPVFQELVCEHLVRDGVGVPKQSVHRELFRMVCWTWKVSWTLRGVSSQQFQIQSDVLMLQVGQEII